MNLKITLNGEPVDPDLFQPLTVGALGTPPRLGWTEADEIALDPGPLERLTWAARGTEYRQLYPLRDTLTATPQIAFAPIDPTAEALLVDPDQAAAIAAEIEQRLTRQLRYQEDRLLDNRPFFDVTMRADGELTFTHKPLLPGTP